MRIFKGLAGVSVDHGVGVVCAAVLSSNAMLSGREPVPGEKRGSWAMALVCDAI